MIKVQNVIYFNFQGHSVDINIKGKNRGNFMEDVNPKIEWESKSGHRYLRFTFDERLTENEAETAITEWREAFQSKAGGKISLIWDCLKMKGYETGARHKWTAALKELKPRIERIWLISDSAFIRSGASVMAVFTSLNIKSVASENDIEF
jgi:hypothetical protein